MTFKDLQKLVQSQFGPDQSQLLQRLRDKPFWIWDTEQHKQEDIKNMRKELLELPGVGDYIADAILVFAFHKRRTIVDSNVIRLVTRFFGIVTKQEMRRNREFVGFCQALSQQLRERWKYDMI